MGKIYYEDNDGLADAFLRWAKVRYRDNHYGFLVARNKAELIRNCSFSIPRHYREHSSLSELSIRRIGSRTTKILEDLLVLGEKEVIGKLAQLY